MPYTVWRPGKNSHFLVFPVNNVSPVNNLVSRLLLAFSCCLTILGGCALLPYAGIQMDEALFAGPYYQPAAREFRLRMFHHDIPLMVMTYIGTLKTLLYWPLMAVFRSHFQAHPSWAAWVFRLPTVLVGALTVYIFFYLTERSSSRRAAVVAALLLASDPTFLITNTFDWGPVALEHVLLVTGCFFLLKYAQDRARKVSHLGIFLFRPGSVEQGNLRLGAGRANFGRCVCI